MEKSDGLQADKDWENRTLCSDESCIGVIGPDGRCKECGLLFAGELQGARSNKEDTEDDPDDEPNYDVTDEESKDQTDAEWENRILCLDESCIGVVGPDGKCKECGLIYEGKL